MSDLTNKEIALGMIPGPVWTERCGHGGYIASFESYNGRQVEKIDLYVWTQKHDGSQSVCLRYGEEDREYYSPVNVTNMILTRGHEPYTTAVRILENKGSIIWKPNEA